MAWLGSGGWFSELASDLLQLPGLLFFPPQAIEGRCVGKIGGGTLHLPQFTAADAPGHPADRRIRLTADRLTEPALGLRKAAGPGGFDPGIVEIGIAQQVGGHAFCLLPVRAAEGSDLQPRPAEIGLAKISAVQSRPPQIHPLQGSAEQAGEAEIRPVQTGPIQGGLTEIGTLQPASTQVGVAQIGMHQIGIRQAAAGTTTGLQQPDHVLIAGPDHRSGAEQTSSAEQASSLERNPAAVAHQAEPVAGLIASIVDGRQREP